MASGLALGAAALSKVAPIAAVPPLFRALGPRFAAGALGIVILALPSLRGSRRSTCSKGSGPMPVTGGSTQAHSHWSKSVVGDPVLGPWCRGCHRPGPSSASRRGATLGVERSLFWVMGAGIALAPTVHPWYVLWMLPFAALRGSSAWLWLTLAAFWGYWGLDTFQDTGTWPEPLGVRLATWVPFYLLLIAAALRPPVRHRDPRVSRREKAQEG